MPYAARSDEAERQLSLAAVSAVTATGRPAADSSSQPDREVRRGDRRPLVVLAVGLAVIGGWLMYISRNATFHYDEWSFILDRRGHGLNTLFAPHNEHVSTVPILIFKVLLHTVGLRHYWPFQVLPIAIELVIAGLVYALARSAIGAWAALVPALLVAGFGTAFQDVLWPFQIGYMIPVATMLAALLLIKRRTLGGDLAACALLIVGTFSSSIGPLLAIAVGCALLLDGRRWVRISRTALLPIVLYAAWSSHWGTAVVRWQRSLTVPSQVLDRISNNLSALTATPDRYGAALAIALVGVLVFHIVTRRYVSQTLVAAAMGALLVMVAQAMFRPGVVVSRYFHAPGVLMVVVIVELLAVYRLPRPTTVQAVAAGALALVVVMAGQASAYLNGAQVFGQWGQFTNASLGAMQIAESRATRTFRPDPVRIPQMNTTKYLWAVHTFGSFAPDIAELRRLPENARENADSVLAQALRITPQPTPRPKHGCRVVVPGRTGVEMRLPDSGLWFSGPVGTVVRLRRFGSAYPPNGAPPGIAIFAPQVIPSMGRVPLPTPVYHLHGTGVIIAPGADGAPNVPWVAETFGAPRVEVCSTA